MYISQITNYEQNIQDEIIYYNDNFIKMKNNIIDNINYWKNSKQNNIMFTLITGEKEVGKTSLAISTSSLDNDVGYNKIISPKNLIGLDEYEIIKYIRRVFLEAYKYSYSIIVLDNIERIIGYTKIGPQFSNKILQTILILIKEPPPKNKKLFIFGTTSLNDEFRDLTDINNSADLIFNIPLLEDYSINNIFDKYNFNEHEMKIFYNAFYRKKITIGKLLFIIEKINNYKLENKINLITTEIFEKIINNINL